MSDCEFKSEESVKSILNREYGFRNMKTAKIDSYVNRNYLVHCQARSKEEEKVIVKIVDQNENCVFGKSLF